MIIMLLEFFKIGLLAIGGGLATIPFLKELSLTYGWFSLEDLSIMIAVSESTPGPIGINMATYVGFNSYGIFGAILMPLALVLPSFIIISLIIKGLEKYGDSKLVKAIFYGLRAAVVALILVVVFDITSMALSINMYPFSFNALALILLIVGLITQIKFKLHPILLICISGLIGLLLKL
ncbi:MAG: chromate transporter [Anaerorhabdus sp.]